MGEHQLLFQLNTPRRSYYSSDVKSLQMCNEPSELAGVNVTVVIAFMSLMRTRLNKGDVLPLQHGWIGFNWRRQRRREVGRLRAMTSTAVFSARTCEGYPD